MSAYFWDDPLILLYLMIAILVLENCWAVYLMLREVSDPEAWQLEY